MNNDQKEVKLEAANRILHIRDEIMDLIDEARELAQNSIESKNTFANLDAYVFDQIEEHLQKGNPYNQDLADVAKVIVDDENEWSFE